MRYFGKRYRFFVVYGRFPARDAWWHKKPPTNSYLLAAELPIVVGYFFSKTPVAMNFSSSFGSVIASISSLDLPASSA